MHEIGYQLCRELVSASRLLDRLQYHVSNLSTSEDPIDCAKTESSWRNSLHSRSLRFVQSADARCRDAECQRTRGVEYVLRSSYESRARGQCAKSFAEWRGRP